MLDLGLVIINLDIVNSKVREIFRLDFFLFDGGLVWPDLICNLNHRRSNHEEKV